MSNMMEKIFQERFATQAKIAMSESKPIGLVKICEKVKGEGGKKAYVYRYKGATAKEGVPSMLNADLTKGYEGDTTNKGGDGGEFERFEIFPTEISSQHKIKKSDMNKTTIDAKSNVTQGMIRAVAIKKDEQVIDAIIAEDTKLKKVEYPTKGFSDAGVVRRLLGRISGTHIRAKMTPDGQRGVVVVMHPEDWEELTESDFLIDQDFKAGLQVGDGETPTKVRGAELLPFENAKVPRGTLYIVPSNTCAWGDWDDSITTDCEYFPTDGKRFHLQVATEGGAKCIEPKYITKFTFKART